MFMLDKYTGGQNCMHENSDIKMQHNEVYGIVVEQDSIQMKDNVVYGIIAEQDYEN